MPFPFSFSVDPFSVIFGFVIATIFWWVIVRARPLWEEIGENSKKRRLELDFAELAIWMKITAELLCAAPRVCIWPPLSSPLMRSYRSRGSCTAGARRTRRPDRYRGRCFLHHSLHAGRLELAAIYDAPTLTLGEALSGGMNLVLIGQPGIGKTVAIAHLASLAANRSETLGGLRDFVPFLVHIADLKLPTDDPKDLLDRLNEITSEHASMLDLGRVPGFVQSSFRSGRALLLLDGYDELTADGQHDVTECLRLLLQAYPKIRIVTTGAPEHIDGLLALRFEPLAVVGWNKQRQAKFMQRWGELWKLFVAGEAWAQRKLDPVDPFLLTHGSVPIISASRRLKLH